MAAPEHCIYSVSAFSGLTETICYFQFFSDPICHKFSGLSNTTPHIERRTNKSQTKLPSNVEKKKQFVYDLLW